MGLPSWRVSTLYVAITDKHFVVRTSGLYGKAPCRAKGGLNFIELMLKLAKERGEVRVVDDEMVTPTSTAELAQQMVQLSRSNRYGLYHATAEGSCSWYEFAQEIFALTDTPVRLKAAAPGEFPAKVARPKYSVLENRALKARGLNVFKPWQHALREYLGPRIRSSAAARLYLGLLLSGQAPGGRITSQLKITKCQRIYLSRS